MSGLVRHPLLALSPPAALPGEPCCLAHMEAQRARAELHQLRESAQDWVGNRSSGKQIEYSELTMLVLSAFLTRG